MAATGADHAGSLEDTGRRADAGAMDAHHETQELVSHFQIVAVGAIKGHQQPAGQALLNVVPPIAGGGLHGLVVHGFVVAQQETSEDRLGIERAPESAASIWKAWP